MMSKPGLTRRLRDEIGRSLIYGPIGIRHIGGVNENLAFAWNVRTCHPDVKGEAQVPKHEASVPRRDTGAEWPAVGMKPW